MNKLFYALIMGCFLAGGAYAEPKHHEGHPKGHHHGGHHQVHPQVVHPQGPQTHSQEHHRGHKHHKPAEHDKK